jgi:hypothetical protein
MQPARGRYSTLEETTNESALEMSLPSDPEANPNELFGRKSARPPSAMEKMSISAGLNTHAAVVGTLEWEEYTTDEGEPYYFNSATGESVWEDPRSSP